jgi:hypothetical protein
MLNFSGNVFSIHLLFFVLQLFNYWIDYFHEAVKTENVSGNTFPVSIGRISFDSIMGLLFSN